MLNRSAPHGQVFGVGGVAWEQGGRLFDFQGYPVDGNGMRAVEPAIEPEHSEGVEGMHWKRLKVMTEQYGEVYTSRDAAIEFLRGKV